MYVDWIVSRHFHPVATDLTLMQMVTGDLENLNRYPILFYTDGTTDAVRSEKLDLLVKDIGSLDNRPDRAALSTLVEQSFFSNNLLAQKTALLLAYFLRAISRQNQAAAAFQLSCTEQELQTIDNLRKRMIVVLKTRISKHELVEEHEIISSYFAQVRDHNVSLGNKDYQAMNNSFVCKNVSLNALRALIRVNMGNVGIYQIYNFDLHQFYSKKELCQNFEDVSASSWKVVVSQVAAVQRQVTRIIEVGLCFFRGFYSHFTMLASTVSPSGETSSGLVLLAAMYKTFNPISFVVRLASSSVYAAGVASSPALMAALPFLVFIAWIKTTGGGWGFEAMVSAGAISNQEFSQKSVSQFYKAKQGKSQILNETQLLRRGISDFQMSLAAFDKEVKTVVKNAKENPDSWNVDTMPAAFRRVCADVATARRSDSTPDFLYRLYQDRSYFARGVDFINKYIPIDWTSKVSTTLQVSLAIDDVIDSRGKVRTPGEICAAVYLRRTLTQQTWFDNFIQGFLPTE
jgi:hypothetical protein